MTETECLQRMKAPGAIKRGKWGNGIIQILVTHACDKACINCTQGSNLLGPKWTMTPDQFRTACKSLTGYHGVRGCFGGNPAASPYFFDYCRILREEVPFERRGLWCNNPLTIEKAVEMRATFNPLVSNLNVHLDAKAYELFLKGWPELKNCPANLFGLSGDSRHSPCYVAMKDVDELPEFDAQKRHVANRPNTEENRLTLIADCDINQHWSPAIGVFRGELRAWFCEIAMAQSIHHQHEPDYPDTGVPIRSDGRTQIDYADGVGKQFYWWQATMSELAHQVRKHCHECGVPMRGYGELAMNKDGKEQVSQTHAAIYKPKREGRSVELVTLQSQLGRTLSTTTHYVQNARV